MIIDNNNTNLKDKPQLANHKDTTVNQVTRVQYEVDNTILELATNIETLKNLYKSKDTFEEFVTVAERLLKDNYDGKNSLDILYENKDFIYDEKTINLLQEVSASLVEINLVSQNLTNIDLSNANIDTIKELIPALYEIDLVGKSIKDVQRIGRNIEKVRVLHTHIIKLITLFDSINELHTIYNYLPVLLKLAAFLKNYTKMIEMIVERFDYHGRIMDGVILEFMEANRNLSYWLDKHDIRITKTETDIENIKKEIEVLKTEINNIKTEIKTIQDTLKQTIERVEKLETSNTEIKKIIENINKEIKEIKENNVIIEEGKNITIDKTGNKYVINATATGGGTTITELNYQSFTL